MSRNQMGDKLQRAFRDRPLTSEEAATDEAIRQQIVAEFPPKARSYSSGASIFSEALRNAIRNSGRTLQEMEQEDGISETLQASIWAEQRELQMNTAGRLETRVHLEVSARA
jgi:hypothetical protein